MMKDNMDVTLSIVPLIKQTLSVVPEGGGYERYKMKIDYHANKRRL
jgi:hypothetical protein